MKNATQNKKLKNQHVRTPKVSEDLPSVEICTDGSCVPNPGKGGWGAVLNFTTHIQEIYGTEKNTTNNRMELTAAIAALSYLKNTHRVTLISDSRYLIDGATIWLRSWKIKNKLNDTSLGLKNSDLWKHIDVLCNVHHITWVWVRGHTGHPGNERADELAGLGAQDKNVL